MAAALVVSVATAAISAAFGFADFRVELVDPVHMISHGKPAEMLVASNWGGCLGPDCWRATFQDGGSRCGEPAEADGVLSTQLGCAFKDGTANDYPYNVSKNFVQNGNRVDPGLYQFRLYLSGPGDGYSGASGAGVDLYGNAGRETDFFHLPSGENAHFHLRVVIGTEG